MYSELFQELVVIGGNASGLAAANQARRINPKLKITVLESGQHISYGTCGMPYYISGYIKNIEDLFAYPKEFFEQKRNIKILLNHKVTGIELAKKEISVNIGGSPENKVINYDRLVICSGASTVIPGIPGIDSNNVFTFRNIEDTLGVKKFIDSEKPGKAIIIGGGSIGFLMAEVFNKQGIKVDIIERFGRILKGYEYEIGTILSKKAEMDGINIHTDASIESIDSSSNGNASSVTVKIDGEIKKIECGIIILSTGIRANTGFLKNTSIELGLNNGIKVNPKLQTSHLNIYAAGDCCTIKNIVSGKEDYIPTANNAVKMGRIAGANIAGGDKVFPGSAGTKVDKIMDLEIAKTGIGLEEASSLGFNAVKFIDSYQSHAGSAPGAKAIAVVIIVDSGSRRLLGAQMIGGEGVGKRIDIFATALTGEMTIDDIYMLDLSYAPAVSTVMDPVNKICGKAILELEKKKF